MIFMTAQFEKENQGYLEQYHYRLEKNESGNYASNDTQILYHGWRQGKREAEAFRECLQDFLNKTEVYLTIYAGDKELKKYRERAEFLLSER